MENSEQILFKKMIWKKLGLKFFFKVFKKVERYHVQHAIEEMSNKTVKQKYTKKVEELDRVREYEHIFRGIAVGEKETGILSDVTASDAFIAQDPIISEYRDIKPIWNALFEYLDPFQYKEQNIIDGNSRNSCVQPNDIAKTICYPFDSYQEMVDQNYEQHLKQLKDAEMLITDDEIEFIRSLDENKDNKTDITSTILQNKQSKTHKKTAISTQRNNGTSSTEVETLLNESEYYSKNDYKWNVLPKLNASILFNIDEQSTFSATKMFIKDLEKETGKDIRKEEEEIREEQKYEKGNSGCPELWRIFKNCEEEDWHGDGSRADGGVSDGEGARSSRGRNSRRDDPRRHTLAGNHICLPHPHHSQQLNSIEMEPPLPRNYHPPLFDDDPGIMSEVETASTGFRRGGKQRSSLPVVRTPSKTLERPLGLVFLQFRNETKRALLPNEITSIDTVKALFVRSFPKQLSMNYMDSPLVKIYIHDSSKDMFYELEDVRVHLREIRDRSVLRLFEATDMGGGVFPGAVGVGSLAMPSTSGLYAEDQSYFSEPEIDSEYHHQHVHKSKVKAPAYYMGTPAPSTLPRGGSLLRAFSPATPPVPADRVKTLPGAALPAEGYMSSPERASARVPYEDPYYTQFMGPTSRTTITPVIDEEAGESVLMDDYNSMYGVSPGIPPLGHVPMDARIKGPADPDTIQRLRVEKMERQLANLTGLVQKALQVPPPVVAPRQEYPQPKTSNQDGARYPSTERAPKLGKDKFQKSVSFEKSVSFSDDPPDMNSPKQHSPQHSADYKPPKPAIKSSTLPRTSSQERDRLKPAPPPKPAGLVGPTPGPAPKTFIITVPPDFPNNFKQLQKQSRDLRIEEDSENVSISQTSREEEMYKQDMLLLENNLFELENTVEKLRGQAANRESRVNMADIERIALVLSKSSKTVAEWKIRFPLLQEALKSKLSSEMEKVVKKEKMLEEEPERLEIALRRCKKLTGTLVTLKRLACVQEQRLPCNDGCISPVSTQGPGLCTAQGGSGEELNSDSGICQKPSVHSKGAGHGGRAAPGRGGTEGPRPENALDALLDELQTFARPPTAAAATAMHHQQHQHTHARAEPPLRRLHSYPSGSDTDASPPVRARGLHPPKPPVPERHPELLAMAARRAPPPPPPRTTSRSPLASPTSPASPPPLTPRAHTHHRSDEQDEVQANEVAEPAAARHALLEHRHQELLKKQKALQEQYARLQQIQRSGSALPPVPHPDLKKTGSESNLLTKMSMHLAPATVSGSLTHIASEPERTGDAIQPPLPHHPAPAAAAAGDESHTVDTVATTNKVYETDIL